MPQIIDAPKIEKNVPLPPGGRGRNAKLTRELWATMEIGDSFFISGRTPQNVSASGRMFQQRHAPNHRFTVRCVTESGVKGVRAWRVA